MKDKILYENLLNILYNIADRKKIRILIKKDIELSGLFKKNVENLYFLERNLKVDVQNSKAKEFAIIFSKIQNKKIEYEVSDETTVEIIERDSNLIKNFILNNTSLLKQDLENEVTIFKFKDIKKEMLDDNKQETIEQSSNIRVAEINETQQIQDKNTNILNPNTVNFNSIFTLKHPLQDPRFYPYKTKPTSIKYLKWVLGASIIIWAIFYALITIFSLSSQCNVTNNDGKKTTVSMFMIANNTMNDFYFLAILNLIFILLFGTYIAYLLFKKPRIYKEQFHIQGLIMFIIGFSVIYLLSILFVQGSSFIKVIFNLAFSQGKTDQMITDFVKNNLFPKNSKDTAGIQNAISIIHKSINFKLFGVFGILFAISSLALVIIFVMCLFANPKFDREKTQRAINEWQKKSAFTLMNQPYDIDESLFEPQSVIDEFNKKNNIEDK